MSSRAGIGWDSHRLAPDRPLVLGGVEIAHDRGLAGHSDADVLTHAIIDALLGAAGLGDIGQHFPDSDERYAGADSVSLLGEVLQMLIRDGWQIEHIDATVLMERPKIAPHRDAMRAVLGRALGVEASRISVKASTGEGMGFVGRLEGAAALAVATVQRRDG